MNDPRSDSFHPPDDPQITSLYRETCDAEPPNWLDQRILSAAQTALDQQSTSQNPRLKRQRHRAWMLPLSLAATVVLAIGLVRWLPPASEISGMPAVLEEKAAYSRSRAAAEKDAPLAKSADSTKVDQANRPAAPAMESRQQPSPTLSAQGNPSVAGHEQATTKADNQAKWLAEIAELRRQGRHTEAEASLTAFRRHYPDAAAESLR